MTIGQLRRKIRQVLREGFADPSRREAEEALAVYLNYIQTHGYPDWVEIQEVTHDALDSVA